MSDYCLKCYRDFEFLLDRFEGVQYKILVTPNIGSIVCRYCGDTVVGFFVSLPFDYSELVCSCCGEPVYEEHSDCWKGEFVGR